MAENNLIKKSDLAKAREIDFVYLFTGSIKKLVEALGVTRKIPKTAGTLLKAYKAVGSLEDGNVGEGELIPLSQYKTTPVNIKEITMKKWRKATSAEAIVEKGFDQAVTMTTDKMLKDVQKGIRKDFFNFAATGTGSAAGSTFQAALAQAWGQLQVLFEDDEIESVYFMNPLDVADYLATANITLQTVFGMTYVEDFLGLGTVFFNSTVPKGKFYATAKDNIVMYYIPVNGADLDEAFSFTSDVTGYIGIHESPDYDNMTAKDTVVSGIELFAERIDGIVVGTIGQNPLGSVTVAPEAGTFDFWGTQCSDLQSDVTVSDGAIKGTLKYLSEGQLVNDWGAGYFLGLKFSDLDATATSIKVGLDPSQGSGLAEITTDPDKNGVFKITDQFVQKFVVVSTNGTQTKTQTFDLSGLKFSPSTGA